MQIYAFMSLQNCQDIICGGVLTNAEDVQQGIFSQQWSSMLQLPRQPPTENKSKRSSNTANPINSVRGFMWADLRQGAHRKMYTTVFE